MKMSVRLRTTLLSVLLLGCITVTASADTGLIDDGIDAFSNSDFETAILIFREALLGEPGEATEADAYFWLSKSAMATGRLGEAERNIEYFLRTFPDHPHAVEARYQRGRILFMNEDYQGAIQAFTRFTETYSDSPFVANAIYWSAEALFNLGRLDESKRLFETVLRDYPTSFRVEAARYRIALIELNAREQELLKLLQWSHEEYLQVLDEFERRERAYQEAITSYQQRLQSAAGEDFREEITRLTTQVRTLQDLLRSREAEIDRLEEQLTSARSEPQGPVSGERSDE
ncbi:MAG: tetratricopeptide repeat protein [Spirochaeta sp.]|jgi:TolA-binding protein|nr:tetratricopeptide repeat protein [Spirochaeta sp.]